MRCSQDLYQCGGNALHMAAIHGNEKEVVLRLLSTCAQIPWCDLNHDVCQVEELVRSGYKIESLDSKGRTPFFLACK